MTRTPIDIPFDELAAAGRSASERADKQARDAGVEVAGKVARQSATVLTLGAHMCKWPIGDPSSDAFTFCGRRATEAGPYCIDHARVADAPGVTRKKAKASGDTRKAQGSRRA